MQRPTKPIPCAQPKIIVSVSKPGSSQKAISAVKIASSTQETRFTQTKSSPGTGFSKAGAGGASPPGAG